MHDPARVLTSSCNFFGGHLDTESDRTLRPLLQPPSDMEVQMQLFVSKRL